MKQEKTTYKVAGHCFEVTLEDYPFLMERMQENYAPFLANGKEEKPVFTATVCSDVRMDDIVSSIITEEKRTPEESLLKVYATCEGWLFEMVQPYSRHINARVRIDNSCRAAQIALRGNEQQCFLALNSALMLCYLLSTAKQDTVLTHASCVVHDGRAYLFLGKSGTGKSTHSSLWLKHIADTTLLNDDHPILRVDEQGEVTAYGSPWSGKTPCYKNESAPVGGIVRIKRAPENSIRHLNVIQAYASLTTSFSGMMWEEVMAESRHRTIEKVIMRVPCYTLHCLPDEEAAQVCHAVVTNQKAKEGTWKNC